MTSEEYAAKRKTIETWEPEGWDMSSSIAFRMFWDQKAEALQNLDDEFNPPSRWRLIKRRLGW